jgi:hypothetical protein
VALTKGDSMIAMNSRLNSSSRVYSWMYLDRTSRGLIREFRVLLFVFCVIPPRVNDVYRAGVSEIGSQGVGMLVLVYGTSTVQFM